MPKETVRLGKIMREILVFFFITLLISAAVAAQSGAQENQNQKDTDHTEISAQKMIFSRSENKVQFMQEVYLERTDLELWCERLTVYLAPEAEISAGSSQEGGISSAQDFERLEAEEQVRIQMQDRTAASKKAVYEGKSDTLLLQGDVKIQEGPNLIQGESVIIYLQEQRSEVSAGEQGRVRAIFYSDQEGEARAK